MSIEFPDEIIAAFHRITTPSVSDALQSLGVHGYVSSRIHRITGTKIVGPAVTVKEEPTDEHVPPVHALEAIDEAPAGAVIVIDNGGEAEVAGWGGIMTAGAVANKLAGVVLDTGVRDVDEIERDYGFTVFAVSQSPSTTLGRFRTVSKGEPVHIGGVAVAQGDLVVGDRDGVVIVPRALVDEVRRIAEDIEERERQQARLILESGSLAQGIATYNRI
ncbi:RraA family protein [Microbacterium sp. Marseille-Q6965]|uniref:RraA family protein n=1 Tax=Microbacterium sp. Marseille-Q6965 TaxID=2965072 RepID=UPI0021B81745|nr:RraA family protein [Microbacterium sp. Marseille-Q6965]